MARFHSRTLPSLESSTIPSPLRRMICWRVAVSWSGRVRRGGGPSEVTRHAASAANATVASVGSSTSVANGPPGLATVALHAPRTACVCFLLLESIGRQRAELDLAKGLGPAALSVARRPGPLVTIRRPARPAQGGHQASPRQG